MRFLITRFLSLQVITAYYLNLTYYRAIRVLPPRQYAVKNETSSNDTVLDSCLQSVKPDGSDSMNLTDVARTYCADDKNISTLYGQVQSKNGFVPGLGNATLDHGSLEMGKMSDSNISDSSEQSSTSINANPKDESPETASTMDPLSEMIGEGNESEGRQMPEMEKYRMCGTNSTSHKVIDRICQGDEDPLIELP
ncbi:hypothetical protein PTTG_11803 [Puccinia triticina 1-1 BBBD Race 1]|uniref:Uncharacterized protein n=2 Tax=Puccinia triticina TaxID=208348 RepID=A0A180G416_PUCT1|nr:uncharacterized protein PtA15_10A362 [Puccinia triticina]OAV87182.1 hypothetical protein PTTG_11803 [Puccinia triticina 1-1 BBBD Race 1]WAQ88939.1 hypothetical protein PtA15_10A362 [Puccinia triticina]WAR58991.1 hypothetical protein PtB15_10B333 [Puccinia triticina]